MKINIISAQEYLPLLPDVTGRKFTTLCDYLAVVEINNRTLRITIPKGFKTDLASVPRVLWSWIPPHGKYLRAAVVHDYFYLTQSIPRKQADRIFKQLAKHWGVGWARANLMYAAVRVGGSYD